MATEAPANIGRGNWIVTHSQMLTLVATWIILMMTTLGTFFAGAIYMYNEHADIAVLKANVIEIRKWELDSAADTKEDNAKMRQQIDKLYCASAGNPKIPACEDARTK
jgi:hypothetical protein